MRSLMKYRFLKLYSSMSYEYIAIDERLIIME